MLMSKMQSLTASRAEVNKSRSVKRKFDQPVAEEDDQPVAEEDDQPVAEEDDQPVAEKDDQPVAEEDDQPVAEEDDQPVAEEDDQPVAEEDDLPVSLKGFYSVENVKSPSDAFALILHAFMLDIGFIPKDVPENQRLEMLPNDWHDNGVYRFVYYHSTCPDVCCLMTCVALDQVLSVFGTIDGVSSFQQTALCLQLKYYINYGVGFSDPSKFFCNVQKLSQNFKNNFGYTLVAAMQDAVGIDRSFGLSVVLDDIKLQILRYLPVQSLLAMSCVNKEFSQLCNTTSLWKNLYLKDFSQVSFDSQDVKQGWKKLYKENYQKRKRENETFRREFAKVRAIHRPPQLLFPPNEWYPPVHPHRGIGPEHNGIPQEIRAAFPHLRQQAIFERFFAPRNPLPDIPNVFRFF